MYISEYDSFVQQSDQTIALDQDARVDIATYGIAAEVGSLISAIKKRMLARTGSSTWNVADAEVIEELGDVIWYCFLLARLENSTKPINIFSHDIANLKGEIGGGTARAERIGHVLDSSKRDAFLEAATSFPRRARNMKFEDYQAIAFLTARTTERTLAEVCLVVLQQLSAELLRRKLPDIELELNQTLTDRPVNDVLGEMAWHVSALASLFGLNLGEVVSANMAKVSDRWDRNFKTPLHDADSPQAEQFPRLFEVAFVTIAPGRTRMYLNGRQFGDELTDNAYEDDGYRFHDVMHLANAANLGWSPVLRRLLKAKRKSQPRVDEVEDGARAQIVEEAVIKAIHSEGARLAPVRGSSPNGQPVRLFTDSAEISFSLLRSLRNLVSGLEVERNRYSEWEAAILSGYEIFHCLRREGQGTVTVDLVARSLSFDARVDPTLARRAALLA